MVAAGADPLNTNITQSPDDGDNSRADDGVDYFKKLSKN